MNGVYETKKGKFNARIASGATTVHLGSFDTERGAAQAYDAAALNLCRPLSAFNYPTEVIPLQVIWIIRELLIGKKMIKPDELTQAEMEQNKIDAVRLLIELAILQIKVKQQTQ